MLHTEFQGKNAGQYDLAQTSKAKALERKLLLFLLVSA